MLHTIIQNTLNESEPALSLPALILPPINPNNTRPAVASNSLNPEQIPAVVCSNISKTPSIIL